MTILFLLFISLALVALIGAALVYAVNRLVGWVVRSVEARERQGTQKTPTTAASTDLESVRAG
ncbi:MAG: hypothetical protein PGN07_00990 [Aeromicrobium erythreum]